MTQLLVAMFCLLLTSTAVASDAERLGIGECFNPLLVTHVNDKYTENYKYMFLSLVNRENYRQIKDSVNTSATTYYGLFTGDYDHFDEERSKLFSLQSESIEYYRAESTEITYLPPSWQPTISDCINKVMDHAGYGLSYFYRLVDPSEIILEVKYVSTEVSPPSIRVRSSALSNATVVGAVLKEQGQLYSSCFTHMVDRSCPALSSRQEFHLHREKLNDSIIVTLNFDNPKHSTSFPIPIVPKKQKCSDNPDEGQDGTIDQTIALDRAKHFTGFTHGSGDNKRDVYKLEVSAPARAVIIGTPSCIPTDSFVDILPYAGRDEVNKLAMIGMNANPMIDKNTVSCAVTRGTGDPRSVRIADKYRIPARSCVDVDWK